MPKKHTTLNFLAHALLSGDNPLVLTGNMVADHVKGQMLGSLPHDMQHGVHLHRMIDSFTDRHERVKHAARMMNDHFGKYAPVVVDIYFDHFLAIGWHRHGKGDLTDFAGRVYRILLSNYNLLPPRSRRILPWMVGQNWLAGYANLRDLRRVFNGMNRRASFSSGMDKAIEVLLDNYTLIESSFEDFWPELRLHIEQNGCLPG